MKIYTRTGDQGTTGLFGGDRVPKTHPRIEAYGTVDELNAYLGLVRTRLRGVPGEEEVASLLVRVQGELLELGADLATPAGSRATVPRLAGAHVERIETAIDRFEADLPPLKQFVLPGGAPAAALLHVARTVCRRAERLTVRAGAEEALSEQAIVYLNRLSDLLFVLSRWVNRQAGAEETPWSPPPSSPPDTPPDEAAE